MGGYTAKEQAEMFKESDMDHIYTNSIYANEDGSITLEMNEIQLKSNQKKFMNNIEENIKTAEENEITVIVSDDYKSVTFESSSKVETNDFMSTIALTSSNIAILQMFLGEDPNDWHLKIKIINADTNTIVKEGSIPDEEIRISPEDGEE